MKQPHLTLLATLAAFSLISCDPKLPEPEPEPAPKSDVTVSLGKTEAVTAASILGADFLGSFVQEGTDDYILVRSGDAVVLSAEPLSGYDGTRTFAGFLNTPIPTDLTMFTKPAAAGATGEVDLSALLPAKINMGTASRTLSLTFGGFPSPLKTLEDVILTEDSYFEVKVSVANLRFTAGTLTPSFNVDLSTLFGIREAQDGILSFETELNKENGYSATRTFHPANFVVKEGEFSSNSHTVRSTFRAAIKTTVSHSGLKTTAAALAAAPKNIKLTVTVNLRNLTIKGFVGKVNFAFKDLTGNVSLPELTREIATVGAGLDQLGFQASSMTPAITVESALPFETSGTVSVTTRRSRSNIATVGDIAFQIPASAEGTSSKSYNLSALADFSPAFVKTPDSFGFAFHADVPDASLPFYLGEPATVRITPVVEVPLVLGAALDYTAQKTMEIPASAAAALKDGTLSLSGTVENKFPLDAEVSFAVLNAMGTALTDEPSLSIPAEKDVPASVRFSTRSGASLEDARSIVVKYNVKGKNGSRTLKKTDYLQADLKATISYQQ